MSPAEFLELTQLGADGAAVHSMNTVSISTAYLVAIFSGAKKLSKFQVAPLGRCWGGAIRPILEWLHVGDHQHRQLPAA